MNCYVSTLLSLFAITLTSAKTLPSILWQSNSPPIERFAAIGDTLDIFCPSYTEDTHASETEQSIIYRVTESEYKSCKVGESARELGRCNSPYKQDKIKVAFRLFSPNPSALEYRPATTYYFISTSSGSKEGLHQKDGGLCAESNLKMIIHVTDRKGNTGQQKTSTTAKPPLLPSDAWSNDPMLAQLLEKLAAETKWIREPSRAERVNLPSNGMLTMEVPSDDTLQYQIHEIGDAESWSSYPSSARSTSISTVTMLLLSLAWIR